MQNINYLDICLYRSFTLLPTEMHILRDLLVLFELSCVQIFVLTQNSVLLYFSYTLYFVSEFHKYCVFGASEQMAV